MKKEIEAGVAFICNLTIKNVEDEKVRIFTEKLSDILCKRYKDHWYPSNPSKGQAYRCIRINRKQRPDESLLQACTESDVDYYELELPKELTLWIDPGEVCCRTGESNGYFTIACFHEEKAEYTNTEFSPELAEQETSDYHSENSSECPSESSTDDEGSSTEVVSSPKSVNSVLNTKSQAVEYYYHPAPFWSPFRRRVVTYVPLYQPVIGYYIIPKVRKFYCNPTNILVPQVKHYSKRTSKR